MDQYYALLYEIDNFADDMGYGVNINSTYDALEFINMLVNEGNNNQDIEQLTVDLNQANEQIQQLQTLIDNLSGALANSQQNIQELMANNDSLASSAYTYQNEVAFLETQLMQIMNQLDASNANSDALQATIQQLQAELEGCNNLEDLGNIVDDYNVLLSQFNTLKRQMSDLLRDANRPNPVRPNPLQPNRPRKIVKR